MTKKQIYSVILQEIKWCEERLDSDFNESKDYKIGFIKGLKQVMLLIKNIK